MFSCRKLDYIDDPTFPVQQASLSPFSDKQITLLMQGALRNEPALPSRLMLPGRLARRNGLVLPSILVLRRQLTEPSKPLIVQRRKPIGLRKHPHRVLANQRRRAVKEG